MSKINSQTFRESIVPLNFLNNLVKKFFDSLGFVEIGKSQKYFNPKERISIANSALMLYNGYETAFNITEGGIFLRVDSMVKIIQNKTVLTVIN